MRCRSRGEAMVGSRADQRRRRLDRVDAAHLCAYRIAPRGEIPSETHMARRRAQQIAVDRDDHVGPVELRHKCKWPTIGTHRGIAHRIAWQRFPLMPSHRRIKLLQRSKLPRERGRGDATGQDTQPLAMRLAPPRALRRQRRLEVLPALRHAAARDAGGAIGIVEAEDLRLRDRVRRTEARRMRGIAIHLDRPPRIVAHQHAARVAAQHAGGREHVAAIGDRIARRTHRRDQLAARRVVIASTEPGERQARRHQLENAPTILRCAKCGGERGKFLRGVRHEGRRTRQLLEAAPLPAQRWHIEQSVRLRAVM
jgi:hypothetical protein